MSEFNKDDYLNDLPDADELAGQGAPAADAAKPADSQPADQPAAPKPEEGPADAGNGDQQDADEDTLTPLGKAKKEAADYLEALQRERAEFINYRNRAKKEQDRFRQHGIIDVLTALLPALDDIDRIREHSEMDDSFKAVAAKIDKAFEKFGVEKFGEKARTLTRPSMTRSCISRIRMPRKRPSTPWWKPGTASATV